MTARAMAIDTAGVLPLFLVGTMAAQLRDTIGLRVEQVGLVFAAYFAAAAALSVPFGHLTDRWGPLPSLRIGVLVYAFALWGSGAASSVHHLVAATVAAGLGTSLTRTASSLLVAQAVAQGRQGLAFGLRNSAIPAAGMLSGLAVPTVAQTVGWRWAFVISGLLAAGVLLLVPKRLEADPSRVETPRGGMSRSVLLRAALAVGMGSATAVTLGAYTLLSAVDAGFSETGAGLLIVIASLLGIASRIAAGLQSDRRPGSQFDLVGGMIALGAFSYAMLALGSPLGTGLGIPIAYASGWAFFGPYYLSLVRLNPHGTAIALGIGQAGAFTGSIVGPLLFGHLARSRGFDVMWGTAAAVAALSAVTMATVHRSVARAGVGPQPSAETRGP